MKILIQIVHWSAYTCYLYLFAKAALFKVFQKPSMMEGMQSFGFGKAWTLLIGYGELLGAMGLVLGLWVHQVKNASVLWLFPFAIGALMVHFAHNDYQDHYEALTGCILSVILLATDSYFKVVL